MKTSFSCCAAKGFFYPFVVVLAAFFSGGFIPAHAATNKTPVLISQSANTRAVAFESVTMRAEPFAPTTDVPFSPDVRTRICIFAMNLELLPAKAPTRLRPTFRTAVARSTRCGSSTWARCPTFPASP